jgi:hypothetical protein
VEDGSVGLAAGQNPELAAAASNGAGGGSGRGRRAHEELALWRLLYSGSVPLAARSGEGRAGHGQCLGGARAARTGKPTGRDRRSVQCLSGHAA